MSLIDGAPILKRGLEILEKDEQSRGVSKEDSENGTRWAFTIAVCTFLLSPVGVWYFLKWLFGAKKDESGKLERGVLHASSSL